MNKIYLVTEIKTSNIMPIEYKSNIFKSLEEAKKYFILLINNINNEEVNYHEGNDCMNYEKINDDGEEYVVDLQTLIL